MKLIEEMIGLKETGYLLTVERFEDSVISSLMERMLTIPVKDHFEMVRLRGMIDGITFLRSEREEIYDNKPSLVSTNVK